MVKYDSYFIVEFRTMILNEIETFQGFIVRKVELEKGIYKYGVQFILERVEIESIFNKMKNFTNGLHNDSKIQESNFCRKNKMECFKAGIYSGEKRKHIRFRIPSPISAKMVQLDKEHLNAKGKQVYIENIGPGGLQFISHAELSPYNNDLYEFDITILNRKLVLKGHIIRKRTVENGFFQYGVKFQIESCQTEMTLEIIEKIKSNLKKKIEYKTSRFCITNENRIEDKEHYVQWC